MPVVNHSFAKLTLWQNKCNFCGCTI